MHTCMHTHTLHRLDEHTTQWMSFYTLDELTIH